MYLAIALSLVAWTSTGAAHPARVEAASSVSGVVRDGLTPLPGEFVGIVAENDVLALSDDWRRVPILMGALTDASGAFSFDPVPLLPGERYWVFTGSLDRFNQFWSATIGGVGGLPARPTKGDLLARGITPLTNDSSHSGLDFDLTVSSVVRDVPIPVGQSGVTLLSDAYLASDGSFLTEGALGDPVILVRSMYDKSGADPNDPTAGSLVSNYATWNLLGYTVIIQNTRGRNGSTGTNDVFRTDAWGGPDWEDGLDSVDWIAAQPWCDGRVGLVGPSALAITTYLAAGAVPEALKACYAWAGTSDLYSLYFDGGAYREDAMERWLKSILGGATARDAYLNAPGSVVDNPERSPFWDAVDLGTRAPFVEVPMLHLVGWFDIFRNSGIDTYQRLNVLGTTATANAAGAYGNQRMLIGPWSHGDWFSADQGDIVYPLSAGTLAGASGLDPDFVDTLVYISETRFFDHWLRLEPRGFSDGYELEDPVRYYVMGNTDGPNGGAGNEWRETTSWPPLDVTAKNMRFSLTGDGRLEIQRPKKIRKAPGRKFERRSFTYDPLDPVPTVGGPILYASAQNKAGPRDQSGIEARPDVLSWTSPRLPRAVELTGAVRCHLAYSTNVTDTDFVVKLTDVYPDGRSILISEGVLQARYRNGFSSADDLMSGDPNDVYQIDVELGSISAVFDEGHRVRIDVTSSNAPRLKPNPNTGASFFTADLTPSNTQVANTTIWTRYWTGTRSSYVILPVVKP